MKKPALSMVAAAMIALFSLTGCALDGAADATAFPNSVSVGPVSAGYPDGMTVAGELEPTQETEPYGVEYVQSGVIFGDPDDYAKRFTLLLCEGLSLDEVGAYAQVAQQQARERVAALEEAAESSELMGESFANAASVAARVEYDEPEAVSIDGRDGLTWVSRVPGDDDVAVTEMRFVAVDDDTVGVLMVGYQQSAYDADPSYYDDVMATLSVL